MSAERRQPVPWRTIFAVIGAVVGVYLLYQVVVELRRILTWIIVAAFFAVLLTPAVDFLERARIRRALGTLIVFLVSFGLLTALLYTFIRPIAREVNTFVNDFPEFVEDAQEGRGPTGRLVKRYNIDEYIEENQARFEESVQNAGAPALSVLKGVANTLAATLTILVLTFLMLLEGPGITRAVLAAMPEHRREHVRAVSQDCSRAVTGYMAGNLVISVIAGITTFVVLSLLDVPFAGVLGLWVAFADLIPLVGATLGAIPTIAVAFLHSTPAGIAVLVFYVLYQQFENHVLQTTIMSRTVDLNPLAVLVSVLIGVELFGFLGALLAIPLAGVLQVIARDIYNEHWGELKDEPSVGSDEVPLSEAT
jgi:predicted PurR-regulated permease PerM